MSPPRMSTQRADRRHRHRLRRPGHGGRLRRARLRGLLRRHRRGEDRAACAAGRIPIWEPGPRGAGRRSTASGCTSRPSSATRSSTRGCCSSPSARRRPTRATPTSPPSTPSSTRCRASDRHALVMKSTVPVRHRREHQARLRRAGQGGFRYVSCPEFLKEGSAVARLPASPTASSIGDDGDWAGDAVEALYAPLDAPLVRTDIQSAEMVKLASNAFLATKISFINEIANVCEETGADVVEVARGMGLDDRIGPKFLQAGHRLRRLVLSQGRDGAQAARRQLGLPLPAPQRGDRGQRAAEAARDRQAAEAPRLARRQGDRAARARLQAEHRRHARGVLARALRAAAGAPARACARTTRWPRRRRAS